MNEFSISARFDNAHQLTVVMDADTGELSLTWVNEDASEVKTGTFSWGEE